MADSRPLVIVKPGVLNALKARNSNASDESLAALLGVSRATYTRVKTGELAPSAVFMHGLVRATGKTLGQLFEVRSDEPSASAA